ncbi:transposase [Sinosporangium siamense]|uniref:Transposase IS4-like domain-containing protein n=1 Tax=Sinosporangium siamense TaxID=1367973 RepID=A0A919RJ02_9ACTN|nr:transposase [Sinosporangium siamense]GII94750.1 hypothetical protein Ssi02_49810 [Sinosporangium siamense]
MRPAAAALRLPALADGVPVLRTLGGCQGHPEDPRDLAPKSPQSAKRAEEPSAGVIDSQSVKGADTVPRPTRGYDANKKINGRKRFIVTDTLGLLLAACAMAASVQDRDGAKTTRLSLYLMTPVRFVFADAGFAGALVGWTRRILSSTLHIVRKAPGRSGFAVIARRWVAERTLVWLTAHRRLARGYERTPATAEAMILWAAISGMARRLTRGHAESTAGVELRFDLTLLKHSRECLILIY